MGKSKLIGGVALALAILLAVGLFTWYMFRSLPDTTKENLTDLTDNRMMELLGLEMKEKIT